jgi:hypothetical protein
MENKKLVEETNQIELLKIKIADLERRAMDEETMATVEKSIRILEELRDKGVI